MLDNKFFDLDLISNKNTNNDSELNELYTNLFNSLGVEPGLLSKTSIGQSLNKKYHDDMSDAISYSERYLNAHKEHNSENDDDSIIIENHSPLFNIINNSHNDINTKKGDNTSNSNIITSNEPYIEDNRDLWKYIRKHQLAYNLDTMTVINQISEYLKKYAPEYHIFTDIK